MKHVRLSISRGSSILKHPWSQVYPGSWQIMGEGIADLLYAKTYIKTRLPHHPILSPSLFMSYSSMSIYVVCAISVLADQ